MVVETTLGTALGIAAIPHAHIHGIDGRRFAPGKRMACEQFPQGFSVDPSSPEFRESRLTDDRKAELRSVAEEVSDHLPGEQRIDIRSFDPTTGNARVVSLESAPSETGHYVERALEHLQNIKESLGLAAAQPVEFAPDPHEQRTSSNAVAVHLQQLYKGIPIFAAAQVVRFAPDGALQDTAGSSITIAEELDAAPSLAVEEAVRIAAEHVAVPQQDEQEATDQFGEPMRPSRVDLSGFEPTVIRTSPEEVPRPTALEAGPFGDEITANLLWFPIDGDLRLTWETVITLPNYESQYRTIVDAETGEILYCKQLVNYVLGTGNVYVRDGDGARQMVDFPRPLGDYGLPIPSGLPVGFPDDWVDVDRMVGNNTNAHQASTGTSFQGQVQPNGEVTFNLANATGPEQQVLNIFYYNNYMHDFFYLLGFREGDGNFQANNLGRGGVGGDRVDARADPGPVPNTANMLTNAEGQEPIMTMGLVVATNRHTAFDSSVVFHEFTHGVTNRLVGGPQNVRALDDPQSRSMGEGWGDYIACIINNVTVVGAWVFNDPDELRGFRYDQNFPDDFGDLGTGRYDADPASGQPTSEHNVGEIWCATLMEMTRNIGKNLALKLVVDALILSPANPSFLDMRDSILDALDNLRHDGLISCSDHQTALNDIWRAFARFGMGPEAQSTGARLTGIVADFNEPPTTLSISVSHTVSGISFGNVAVGDSRRMDFGITNDGTDDVTVTLPTQPMPPPLPTFRWDQQGSFVVKPCSQNVVSIEFNPKGEGFIEQKLTITSNASGSPHTIRLHGRAIGGEVP
jgi:extracellular elastinolytic metalloproteinase